jgi:hypothetical protein
MVAVWAEQRGNTGSAADALAVQGRWQQRSGSGDEQWGSRLTVQQQQRIGVIALESSYRIRVTCFDLQKLFAKVSFRKYEQVLL